ncbi:hypothetical protein LSTR_LSTR013185 [Laodelphax striatellus]|uniref:Uncharacterized protein n=1 Tax=Laodelphax striatellus TaxID=195883 RepID=A0A482X5B7_LAOST|nr:hypothetical protein LSTR_LSTR013185 [Laodelphax striatellus]
MIHLRQSQLAPMIKRGVFTVGRLNSCVQPHGGGSVVSQTTEGGALGGTAPPPPLPSTSQGRQTSDKNWRDASLIQSAPVSQATATTQQQSNPSVAANLQHVSSPNQQPLHMSQGDSNGGPPDMKRPRLGNATVSDLHHATFNHYQSKPQLYSSSPLLPFHMFTSPPPPPPPLPPPASSSSSSSASNPPPPPPPPPPSSAKEQVTPPGGNFAYYQHTIPPTFSTSVPPPHPSQWGGLQNRG